MMNQSLCDFLRKQKQYEILLVFIRPTAQHATICSDAKIVLKLAYEASLATQGELSEEAESYAKQLIEIQKDEETMLSLIQITYQLGYPSKWL